MIAQAWTLTETLRAAYEAATPGTLRQGRLLRAWAGSLRRTVRREGR